VYDLFTPNQVSVHRYMHNPMSRELAYYEEEAQMGDVMLDMLRTGKRLLLVFRAKSTMEKIVELIDEQVPEVKDKKLLYWSDTADTDMKEFAQINETIETRDIRVIMATSKMTVAADITAPIFASFGFLNTRGGSTARDSLQGLNRARNLTSRQMHLSLGKLDSKNMYTQTVDQATWSLKASKKLRVEYASLLAYGTPEKQADGTINWTENNVQRMLAYALAEQNTGFNRSFEKLIKLSNYKKDEVETAEEAVLKISKAELRDARYAAQKRDHAQILSILELQRTPAAKTWKELQEMLKRCKKQQASTQDKQLVRVLLPYFKFNEVFQPHLTVPHILAAIDKHHVLEKAG